MTDAVAAPASAPVAPVAPGGKVKRLPKPDKDAFNKQLEKIDAEISKQHDRIAELKQMIDDKMNGKDVAGAESREAANKIAGLSNDFETKLSQKRQLQKQLDDVRKSQDELKSAARDLRGTLQFIKLEDIDAQVARIEDRITHETNDLTEERRLIDSMKELTKSRQRVVEYQAQVERIQADQGLRDDLQKRIADIDNDLAAIKTRKDDLKSVLQKLKEKEASRSMDIPSLSAAKKAAYDVSVELREAKRKMITEFRAKEDEFWQRERAWREQMKDVKHLQYLQRQAQREARDAERKFQDDAAQGEPYADELLAIDQLATYLGRYRTVQQGPAAEASQAPAAVHEGMKLLKKKLDDNELDPFYAGVGKKKGPAAKAASKKEDPKKDDAAARLTHTLEVLASFEKVKVAAPTTKGAVEAALSQLEAQKVVFKELQVKGLAERAAAREAGEAAEAPEAAWEEEEGAEREGEEGAAEGHENGDAAEDKPEPEVEPPAAASPEAESPEEDKEVEVKLSVDKGEVSVGIAVNS